MSKTKKTPKPKTEPSDDASPRLKKLVAEANASLKKKRLPIEEALGAAGVDTSALVADAKTSAEPTEAPSPAAAGDPTVRAIADAYLEHLRSDGTAASTIASYARQLDAACSVFGALTPAAAVTPGLVSRFNTSPAVTQKPNGKPRAQPTILQMRRTPRLAFAHAMKTGVLRESPFEAAAV